MRTKIINFLKTNPVITRLFWKITGFFLNVMRFFIRPQPKTMLFSSFGGRNFDDSPKAIFQEVCAREEFRDWRLIWAFVQPDAFSVPRAEKIKIDTMRFFMALLYSKVWVSNSGMTRGITIKRKDVIRVETWHGSALKKICGDEHQNTIGGKKKKKGPLDARTIRCVQSEYDRDLFARLFHAEKDAFLKSGLPRNDALLRYSKEDMLRVRKALGIPDGKKVILYTPTYREYLIDENKDMFIAPPMDLEKWRKLLGGQYVLLMRMHYAVTAAMNLKEDGFVYDVSKYPNLNDLYVIADLMISDYSSTFFDYSILDRPMLCFAYDLAEYEEKRGLYMKLQDVLPCPVDQDEDTLIHHILHLDEQAYAEKTKEFHRRFVPYAGAASKMVVDEIIRRL